MKACSALIVIGIALTSLSSSASQKPTSQKPTVILRGLEDVVGSDLSITASIEPAGTRIKYVEFVVDRNVMCRVENPPFTCRLRFGNVAGDREVIVSAQPVDAPPIIVSQIIKLVPVHGVDAFVPRVNVTAIVKDGRGRAIRDLEAKDFRLLEDGVEREIDVFFKESVPLSITVAADVSGSMSRSIDLVKQALREFVEKLGKGNELSLFAFNDGFEWLSYRETRNAERLMAIARMSARGRTRLYDAMAEVLESMARTDDRVPVLILFTDGDDVSSRASAASVANRAKTTNALVYVLALGGVSDRDRDVLQGIAKASGGEFRILDNERDLGRRLSEIHEDLGQLYTLTFAPAGPPDGREHLLTVQIRGRKGLTIRARQRYLHSAR
jgi:VWFA-related protein